MKNQASGYYFKSSDLAYIFMCAKICNATYLPFKEGEFDASHKRLYYSAIIAKSYLGIQKDCVTDYMNQLYEELCKADSLLIIIEKMYSVELPEQVIFEVDDLFRNHLRNIINICENISADAFPEWEKDIMSEWEFKK